MKTKIIAEVAQGYEGNLYLAELLARAAINGKADAAKFQLVFADELCVPNYPYYDFFSSLEFSFENWEKITNQVKEAGLEMFFDVYGPKSLDWAHRLGAAGIKISTTDFYNTRLIDMALEKFDQVLISIGGVPQEEFAGLWKRVKPFKDKITFLHGFQAEPTETHDNHLLRMKKMRELYPGIKIGFMDHSLGTSEEAFHLPLVALGVGVELFEKHISLDPNLEVEDYISALSPTRFKEFVKVIREMEKALGTTSLGLTEKEKEYKLKAGKVVVADQEIPSGTELRLEHLALKRVSTEPNPDFLRQVDYLIGKKVSKNFSPNNPLFDGDLS